MRKEGRPANKAEAKLFDLMIEANWQLTKRGWPDFICRKDSRVVAIEVKTKRSHRLKEEQKETLLFLASLGVECYRWTSAFGFERVLPTIDSLDKPGDFHISQKVMRGRMLAKLGQITRQQPSINKSLGLT